MQTHALACTSFQNQFDEPNSIFLGWWWWYSQLSSPDLKENVFFKEKMMGRRRENGNETNPQCYRITKKIFEKLRTLA